MAEGTTPPDVPDDSGILQWQPADTTLLNPTSLRLPPKVLRAWDRKPLSPFSRSRLRVGKVWKRSVQSFPKRYAMQSDGEVEGRARKRRRALSSSSGSDAATMALDDRDWPQPAKKMCLGLELRDDASESPAGRKIVTRSSFAASGEEIVALAEEGVEVGEGGEEQDNDDDDEVGNVTVEIVDENGVVIGSGEDNGQDAADWEDEVVQEEAAGATFQSVEIIPQQSDMLPVDTAAQSSPATEDATPVLLETGPRAPELEESLKQSPIRRREEVVLPEGFVSPVKRPITKSGRRSSLASSRRRTLPVQFAPAFLAPPVPDDDSIADGDELEGRDSTLLDQTVFDNEILEDVDVETEEIQEAETQLVNDLITEPERNDEDWEDVESDISDEDLMHIDGDLTSGDETLFDSAGHEDEDAEHPDTSHHELQDTLRFVLSSGSTATIEAQHLPVPRRRSPRRKSTSPQKPSAILPSQSKSHLLAFTPIKSFPPPYHTTSQELSPTSPPPRASSAPPAEETPRKSSRPRISDDTALITAFLNRNQEARDSQLSRTSEQESLENRRDSDAVRLALASPAQKSHQNDGQTGQLVLGELDPNSPSPRKSGSVLDQPVSDIFDAVIDEAARKAVEDEEEDGATGTRTRRSARSTRRQNTAAAGPAPNRIAIRPNSENIVLKRSDAQEMALLTRNNTRKNKGTAILPPLRLTKMALIFGTDLANNEEEIVETKDTNASKGVRWAETLTEFYAGGGVTEDSVMSDELASEEGATGSIGVAASSSAAATPPPPAETPSKPKIRRLKPPSRTAATPSGRTSPPTEELICQTVDSSAADTGDASTNATAKSNAKASTSRRRSRIATPAKGLLSSASLLPADLEPAHAVQQQHSKKRSQPAPSKLPTLPPTSLPASASVLGLGKENTTTSLLASPPKKKAAAAVLPSTGASRASLAPPKFDFAAVSGMARFGAAPTVPAREVEPVMPSLMSPAKKGGRGRMMGAEVPVSKKAEVDASVPAGLSSPAKKRTRRAL